MRARTQDSKWRVPSAPLNQLCRQSHPASRLAEANFARHQHLIAAFVLEEIKGLTGIFDPKALESRPETLRATVSPSQQASDPGLNCILHLAELHEGGLQAYQGQQLVAQRCCKTAARGQRPLPACSGSSRCHGPHLKKCGDPPKPVSPHRITMLSSCRQAVLQQTVSIGNLLRHISMRADGS